MTLQEIMDRLIKDGYKDCYYDNLSPKCIIVGQLGEIELAHGEAKIFDRKHPWPGYGDHACHKKIDDLFTDIHVTWPIKTEETPCSTPLSELSTQSLEEVARGPVIKDENPVNAGCQNKEETANENH